MELLKKLLAILFVALLIQACGNNNASPKAIATGTIGAADIEIVYHQPSARGRTMIGGDKVPYEVVWRTGANDATTFETSGDLVVVGKVLPKGKYGLFTIPGESEWTIIFNSVHDMWGKNGYDEAKDVLRVVVSADKTPQHVETFSISVENDGIVLMWENSFIKVPLQ